MYIQLEDEDSRVDKLNPGLQLATQLIQCPGFSRPVNLAQSSSRRPPWSPPPQHLLIVFNYFSEFAQGSTHVSAQLPHIMMWKGCQQWFIQFHQGNKPTTGPRAFLEVIDSLAGELLGNPPRASNNEDGIAKTEANRSRHIAVSNNANCGEDGNCIVRLCKGARICGKVRRNVGEYDKTKWMISAVERVKRSSSNA